MFILNKSNKKDKKFMVITDTGKTIHFGATGYGDYIYYSKHNKELANTKKKNYIARHRVRENFNNKYTAGFWALNILWNKPTLRGSINDTSRKHNIIIHII